LLALINHHNTPATETTAIGSKNRWPNGYGHVSRWLRVSVHYS
jgi:hypothetical protein